MILAPAITSPLASTRVLPFSYMSNRAIASARTQQLGGLAHDLAALEGRNVAPRPKSRAPRRLPLARGRLARHARGSRSQPRSRIEEGERLACRARALHVCLLSNALDRCAARVDEESAARCPRWICHSQGDANVGARRQGYDPRGDGGLLSCARFRPLCGCREPVRR